MERPRRGHFGTGLITRQNDVLKRIAFSLSLSARGCMYDEVTHALERKTGRRARRSCPEIPPVRDRPALEGDPQGPPRPQANPNSSLIPVSFLTGPTSLTSTSSVRGRKDAALFRGRCLAEAISRGYAGVQNEKASQWAEQVSRNPRGRQSEDPLLGQLEWTGCWRPFAAALLKR